ncbi:hypothetical protein AU486_08760 [Lonsdalea quercina]|nr:hypothetical protein AU486_08760 [Lonsdalea quercina]RAT44615.1 hypothetical protein AU494_06995 [Lonsdalea populi]
MSITGWPMSRIMKRMGKSIRGPQDSPWAAKRVMKAERLALAYRFCIFSSAQHDLFRAGHVEVGVPKPGVG